MAKTALTRDQELLLTDEQFEFIRQFVHARSGIALSAGKRDLVYGRLRHRLHAHQMSGFDEYCALLKRRPETESRELINAITTNLTAFFREAHHFEFVRDKLMPAWLTSPHRPPRIRLWSAGCATGEEPYSLAITVLDALGGRPADLDILATDIDTQVLADAATATYAAERIKPLRPAYRRWFQPTGGAEKIRVAKEITDLIRFRQLNLSKPWPSAGPFDLIFCRNVVIYFDKETQRNLFERLADALVPNGHLVIGHSETLFNMTDRFELIGRTIYRKRI